MVVKEGETKKWLKMLGIEVEETGRAVDEKGESTCIHIRTKDGKSGEFRPLANRYCILALRPKRAETETLEEDLFEVPLVGEEIPKWKLTLLTPSITEGLEPVLIEIVSIEELDEYMITQYTKIIETLPPPEQCLKANLKEKINLLLKED